MPRTSGLVRNLNLLVPLAQGRLFKWAPADDILRPGYLERCVAALDADPAVVLAYPQTDFVDGDDAPLDLHDPGWNLVSDDPSVRLLYAICAEQFVNAILGVIRTDALRRTRLMPRMRAATTGSWPSCRSRVSSWRSRSTCTSGGSTPGRPRAMPRTARGCAATESAPERACGRRTGTCAAITSGSSSGRRSRQRADGAARAAGPYDGVATGPAARRAGRAAAGREREHDAGPAST